MLTRKQMIMLLVFAAIQLVIISSAVTIKLMLAPLSCDTDSNCQCLNGGNGDPE